MKLTLSGLVLIRNGEDLDYCYKEAITSLLPVCDQVVVCDGESTDGTQSIIREWAKVEPKIKICVYPWPDPKGDIDFYVNWIQYGRQHVKTDFLLHLDADEILDDTSYPVIEKLKQLDRPQYFSVWCDRLNFYKDATHLIPPGVCLSNRVIRISPQSVWLPSDGPHPNGGECVGMAKELSEPVRIMHYGFLRDPKAFFRKARALQGFFFNSYDYRLAAVEGEEAWMLRVPDVEWINRLDRFFGRHPLLIHSWLKQRGYTP